MSCDHKKQHCDIFGILSDHWKQWQNCPRLTTFPPPSEKERTWKPPKMDVVYFYSTRQAFIYTPVLSHVLFFFLKLTLVMNILCVAMRHTCSRKHKKDKEPKPASHWAFANNLEKQVCWGELNSFRGTLAFQSDQLDVIWITTTMWHHERFIELNGAWNECFCRSNQKGFSFKDVRH